MLKNRIQVISFFTLLIGTGIALLWIFKPFFSGLLLALTAAIIARPLYRYLETRFKRPNLAAIVTFLIVVAIIAVPVGIIGGQIVNQAQNVYTSYQDDADPAFTYTSESIMKQITEVIPGAGSFDVAKIKEQLSGWLSGNLNKLFSSALSITINSFIFLFALFYLLRDGDRLKKALHELSPLTDTQTKAIVVRFENTVRSVVVGSLLVALIQGAITTIGLLIFRVPEAFLLGSASVIAALIPGVGPSIIMLPAAVFLYFSGHTTAAIGLAIWSIIIVGTIDNLIRPFLIERGMNIHPFLILISVLGGLAVFGPIGFLVGPIVLSLFFTLSDIYIRLDDKKTK